MFALCMQNMRRGSGAEFRGPSAEGASHFLLDLIVRYSRRAACIHSFKARTNVLIPGFFDLVALGGLVRVKQKTNQREAFAARELDDFLGYFLYGAGHGEMLRGQS